MPHIFDGIEEIASVLCEVVRLVVGVVRGVDVGIPATILDFQRPEVSARALICVGQAAHLIVEGLV